SRGGGETPDPERKGGGPEWRGCPLVGRHHVNYTGWLGEREEEEAVSRATGGQGEAVVAEPGLRSAGQSTEQDWLEAVASEAGAGAGLGLSAGRKMTAGRGATVETSTHRSSEERLAERCLC
ncbi:hypothetical protein U0070_014259, partial [Myodes glareolus]